MSLAFNEAIFGKNDIRGLIQDGITPETFFLVGKAYAKYIMQKGNIPFENSNNLWVSVAQDARLHSPELTKALIHGLRQSGINVLDIGLCPTPLAYFSEYLNLDGIDSLEGTLIVTASHNPPDYNGLKMTYKKATFSEEEIIQLKEITLKEDFYKSPRYGSCKRYDIVPDYINTVINSFSRIDNKIKVVVDSGNATGGIVAPQLYKELGCEVIDIYSEPDGNFPHHHPDPSKEKNLELLKQKIQETEADFGIAFDGDSDRIGVVDNTGYSIPGDQLLLIFALDILKDLKARNEKPVFVSEVKCSQVLYDTINQNGGQAIMWKTGHSYIKSKMKEENAILAGEMSGHIFFRDRYYGFDDAVYAGCRFIEIIAKNKLNNPEIKVSDIIESLPKTFTSREVRTPCDNSIKFKVIENLKALLNTDSNFFSDKILKIDTTDGMRIIFDGGFALIRASNTEPTFTLRFEGKTQEAVDRYKTVMLNLIEENMNRLMSEIK